MKIYKIIALFIFIAFSIQANTDIRNWKLTSGDRFDAELVEYNPVEDVAVLRMNDGEIRTYPLAEFSSIDVAWLIEWAEFSQELDEMMINMKGDLRHFQHQGAYPADCYVYTPSKYRKTTELPLLFLFHPGGKGARYVQRFMLAAETLGIIVVSSDAFRNTSSAEPGQADFMFECFKELLPELKTVVPHDSSQFYLGGTSGGAMKAFEYTARIDHPWAGVFSNGGWLGGKKYYDRPYPAMRVAMVNGNRDHAANRWVDPDTTALEKHGCNISLFAFEGAHQIPPPTIQVKALSWLITSEFASDIEE